MKGLDVVGVGVKCGCEVSVTYPRGDVLDKPVAGAVRPDHGGSSSARDRVRRMRQRSSDHKRGRRRGLGVRQALAGEPGVVLPKRQSKARKGQRRQVAALQLSRRFHGGGANYVVLVDESSNSSVVHSVSVFCKRGAAVC